MYGLCYAYYIKSVGWPHRGARSSRNYFMYLNKEAIEHLTVPCTVSSSLACVEAQVLQTCTCASINIKSY